MFSLLMIKCPLELFVLIQVLDVYYSKGVIKSVTTSDVGMI